MLVQENGEFVLPEGLQEWGAQQGAKLELSLLSSAESEARHSWCRAGRGRAQVLELGCLVSNPSSASSSVILD